MTKQETLPHRVVIAEDSVLLRDGLVRLVESYEFDVCASIGDSEQLLSAVTNSQPDLVITDVRMPPSYTDEGLQAALKIRALYSGTPILILSQYVDERYAAELLAGELSGLGYLLKDRVIDPTSFIESMRTVTAGGTVIDTEVVQYILRRSQERAKLERLTPREHEVLGLMAEGKSNAGISQALTKQPGCRKTCGKCSVKT